MRTIEMGRVVVEAKVVNNLDLGMSKEGNLPVEKVRSVMIQNALVDTGATYLTLPTRYIRELGLLKTGERKLNTAAGPRTANQYDVVRLHI